MFLLQGINYHQGKWQTIAKDTDQFMLEQTQKGLEELGNWDEVRVIDEQDADRENSLSPN